MLATKVKTLYNIVLLVLSSPWPVYQNEGKCLTFDLKMIFHSPANKTHFHKKGCALGLILKVRVLGTLK